MQAKNSASCRHPVVGVAMPFGSVKLRGANDKSIGGFFGVPAKSVDLYSKGIQAVRFMPTQVRYTGQFRG